MTCVGGFDDIFIAKFRADGGHVWSDRYGDAEFSSQSPCDLAADNNNNVVFVGQFDGTLNFGGYTLIGGSSSSMYTVKFDSTGTHVWSDSYGNPSYAAAKGVAIDPSRNILVTGVIGGSVNFGGGSLTRPMFVVKFDEDGYHVWSRDYGDGDYNDVSDIAVDLLGNVSITGSFEDDLNFGGISLVSAGYKDIFLAKFDVNGNHVWSQRFGNNSADDGYSVDTDGLGNVVAGGYFFDTVDFGGGQKGSTGRCSGFVAKFEAESVPTVLREYTAINKEHGVEIRWLLEEASSDIAFRVYRIEAPESNFREIFNAAIIRDDLVFTFVDETCTAGTSYRYRVDLVDEQGKQTLFETGKISVPIRSITLHQNRPNPFNPSTTLSFDLPWTTQAKVSVYDAEGRFVVNLVDEVMNSGYNEVTWDGTDAQGTLVASGIYFCRLKAGKQELTKKMVLLK